MCRCATVVAVVALSLCTAPVAAEVYGLDVLVTLGAPGCQFDDGGNLEVTNTNIGATLEVSWHGFTTDPDATPNITFDSNKADPTQVCITGECANACPSDEGECDHPDLNPTPNDSCTICLCELADQRRVLAPLEKIDSRCNYAVGCTGTNCDNPDCPTVDFCSILVPGSQGELGIIAEIHAISFDDPGGAQCWLDLTGIVLDDTSEIDVEESPECP